MSLGLYNEVSEKVNRLFTNSYSTSFSLGIRMFSPEFRGPVYTIYGYVRLADEIVDTFHGFDKKKLLEEFRNDTREAIECGISTNPVLQAFQEVVRKYGIEWEMIEAFLDSMEMDLTESSYDRKVYDNYIYGSAEAVGLMCLRVFCKNDTEMYDRLKYPAQMLGAAFQKVNFLRDIKSDLDERGRIYLPNVHEEESIDDANKRKLEDEISKEFHEALQGIKELPDGAKLGVYSAYLYYYVLFNKIKRSGVSTLLSERVRINNFIKFILLIKSFFEVKIIKTT